MLPSVATESGITVKGNCGCKGGILFSEKYELNQQLLPLVDTIYRYLHNRSCQFTKTNTIKSITYSDFYHKSQSFLANLCYH